MGERWGQHSQHQARHGHARRHAMGMVAHLLGKRSYQNVCTDQMLRKMTAVFATARFPEQFIRRGCGKEWPTRISKL